MNEKDLVDLVFVTPHNFLYACNMERKEASQVIAMWFDTREEILKEGPNKEIAENWLKKATFAYNVGSKECPYSYWAIGWEHVLGLYTREHEPNPNELLAKAQMKMATVLEKQADKLDEGDNWKGDPDE
jgi:hypothetical protein